MFTFSDQQTTETSSIFGAEIMSFALSFVRKIPTKNVKKIMVSKIVNFDTVNIDISQLLISGFQKVIHNEELEQILQQITIYGNLL